MLVTYIENYSKKVLMEQISTSPGTSSKDDFKQVSINTFHTKYVKGSTNYHELPKN